MEVRNDAMRLEEFQFLLCKNTKLCLYMGVSGYDVVFTVFGESLVLTINNPAFLKKHFDAVVQLPPNMG